MKVETEDVFEDMLNILNNNYDHSVRLTPQFVLFPDMGLDSEEDLNLSMFPQVELKKRKRISGHVISKEEKRKIEANRRAENKKLLEEAKNELEKRGLLLGIKALKSSKSRYSVEKIHIINRLTNLVNSISSTRMTFSYKH